MVGEAFVLKGVIAVVTDIRQDLVHCSGLIRWVNLARGTGVCGRFGAELLPPILLLDVWGKGDPFGRQDLPEAVQIEL